MLRSLIYVVIFVAGTFAGGAFPAYFMQYQHRVNSQFDQVTMDLATFQLIADDYHEGSLDALVRHHLASADPTFHDEGLAIRAMVRAQQTLVETRTSFDEPVYRQAWYLFANADTELARTTWRAYTPALVTTTDAVIFALSVGLALSLACFIVMHTLRSGFRRLVKRRHA